MIVKTKLTSVRGFHSKSHDIKYHENYYFSFWGMVLVFINGMNILLLAEKDILYC